ncbi:MAG TPA: hypothetical protein VHR45_02015 [Thermoanaerobaculia bacterium]|nr:hypothetical protein [Thermoanaerobaculia bacterium]
MKRFLIVGFAVAATALGARGAAAQGQWYKFSKDFVASHFAKDSAIGELEANAVAPAKSVHRVSCGGNDGELHVGIEGKDIVWTKADQEPLSAPAGQESSDFGVVAEPVNLEASTQAAAQALAGQAATFEGYYRLWNEGHDRGNAAPSNPHHVLELHPVWAFHGDAEDFNDPASIRPMQSSGGKAYSGYGASKFRPLLAALSQEQWLHVYEDDRFVYVELQKAENFYQLPVTVNDVHQVTGGVEAVVDVFSDEQHQNLVFSGLRVVANDGSRIAARLQAGEQIQFLLGLFSVNLRKAMELAAGHSGPDNAVFAPSALELFAYGVPLGKAVSSSKCVAETPAE